jgi:hypothetical protein
MSSLLDTRRLEDERVELSSRRSGVMEALEEVQQKFEACKVIHFHDLPFLISWIVQMFLNVALLL